MKRRQPRLHEMLLQDFNLHGIPQQVQLLQTQLRKEEEDATHSWQRMVAHWEEHVAMSIQG
eukprot:9654961-Prorocentrum_lima.AAC.1